VKSATTSGEKYAAVVHLVQELMAHGVHVDARPTRPAS
jgi:hypothetical protein